jgi:hypothetical protein
VVVLQECIIAESIPTETLHLVLIFQLNLATCENKVSKKYGSTLKFSKTCEANPVLKVNAAIANTRPYAADAGLEHMGFQLTLSITAATYMCQAKQKATTLKRIHGAFTNLAPKKLMFQKVTLTAYQNVKRVVFNGVFLKPLNVTFFVEKWLAKNRQANTELCWL